MYLCSSLGENPNLVCTSRSLVEMEKTPERLLMNIPEEPFTGSCKEVTEEHPPCAFLIYFMKVYYNIYITHTYTSIFLSF